MQAATHRPAALLPEAALLLLLVALTTTAAGLTVELGWAALTVPLLSIAVALALVAPYELGLAVAGCAIALEPGAIDASGRLSELVYEMPPGISLPITTSPLEIALVIACASALAPGRERNRLQLPLLIVALPIAVAAGFLHGWRMGGEMNLAYNEARGLIFGAAAFLLAAFAPDEKWKRLQTIVFLGTTVLAGLIVYRYLVYVRTGDLTVPIEFAFAHEDSIMLGIGLVCGVTALCRPSLSMPQRLLLMAYIGLMLIAMMATQRRAATLVALVGLGTVGAIVFTRRPALVTALAVPALLAFGAYLGTYWNHEYGTLSQPARAVRSQIDPTPRDESSDLYRDIERTDVIETVRLNRLQGVGFGRPFAQFQSLPNLQSFWPLQLYTPHQNILWLWLKLGIAGMAAFLGVVSIALGRALAAARTSAFGETRFVLATGLAAALLMYIAFATVDLALIGTRGTLPLAVGLGLAFRLHPSSREPAT